MLGIKTSFFKKTFLIFIFSSFFFVFATSHENLKYQIKWQGVQHYFIEEDEKIEYIAFDNALYYDTLPGIPYFLKQFRTDVPHITYDISLSNVKTKVLSKDIEDFVRNADFFSEDFKIITRKVSTKGNRFLELNIIPIRFNNETGQFEKLVSFEIEKKYIHDEAYSDEPAQTYADNSVLATGNWYKLCVNKTGIYKINYDDLESLGIDAGNIKRKDISLFGNGSGMLPEANDEFRYSDLKENAIYVSGNPDDNFSASDHILFYGKSPHQWRLNDDEAWYHEVHLYSDENCYFLTTDSGEGKRINQQNSVDEPATKNITSFIDYDYHQKDERNLIGSGRIWYGEVFSTTVTRNFEFSFDDLVNGGQGHIKTHLAARSPVNSSFFVKVNDGQQRQINLNSINVNSQTGQYARNSEDNLTFSQSSSNISVEITYNRPSTSSIGWLNYIALNVERHLRFREGQLKFRSYGLENEIAEFKLSNANNSVEVWDVTDRFNIKRQQGELQSNDFVFRANGEEDIMKFVAHDGSNYYTPRLRGRVANQNLHGKESHDLVIVTPAKFLDQAEKLASFRRDNDNLDVLIVTTEQVYNEFSSGIQDKSAIRNFMKMFYDRALNEEEMPRYLLLFGNGTYDNKDILGYGGNFIPTFQTKNSLNRSSSWMSDDFFGLLADGEGEGADGDLDIGVGRLPIRTQRDASAIVDKIIRYEKRIDGWDYLGDNYEFAGMVSNYDDWRNRIALIADDGDNNTHFKDSETLYNIIKEDYPVYNIDKIYLDAYEKVILAGGERYPDVNKAINELVNKGALLINYIGHGGFNGLSHQRILTFDDIQTWNNYYNLPVFMTATCEFSAFDIPDPSRLSAGVRVFLKSDGGASALFTTTRLAWSGSNMTLNRNFMENAFKPMENGEYPRLGDIIRKAKVASGSGSNIMNFVLLGDPSMQLAYPEKNVETVEIPDTIKALEHVTVKGKVVDNNGMLLNNYNGVVYPTIYDKRFVYQTRGNSSSSIPAEFEARTNILFNGKASVENGEFEFEFIVPRDIGYNFGEGKISYYLDDGNIDGHGYYDNFIVGGTADEHVPDYEGPQIDMFLNDTDFVSGQEVDPDPLLLAYLFDESGINTTGQLGHEIVAILNDNTANQIVLNDYYESDLDTYRSGKVIYPFSNLEEGKYSLKMRVWDAHNNPAEETIEFIVAGHDGFALINLINYPNPFTETTTFAFSYVDTEAYEMDVKIDIYNIKGKRVATIDERINITGFDEFNINWNGSRNDNGALLETGMYIYNVTVTTQEGDVASKSNKLLIVR